VSILWKKEMSGTLCAAPASQAQALGFFGSGLTSSKQRPALLILVPQMSALPKDPLWGQRVNWRHEVGANQTWILGLTWDFEKNALFFDYNGNEHR
jgi:hypothetical protein